MNIKDFRFLKSTNPKVQSRRYRKVPNMGGRQIFREKYGLRSLLKRLSPSKGKNLEKEDPLFGTNLIDSDLKIDDLYELKIKMFSEIFEDRFESLNKDLEDKIDRLNDKIEDKADDLENKVEFKIHDLEDEIEDRIEFKINALEEKVDFKIDALEHEFDRRQDLQEERNSLFKLTQNPTFRGFLCGLFFGACSYLIIYLHAFHVAEEVVESFKALDFEERFKSLDPEQMELVREGTSGLLNK